MALTQVSTGDTEEWINSNGTRNLTQDTGTAVGDIAIVAISAYPNGTTVTGPVGFTAITPFTFSSSGLDQSTIYLFYKEIVGGETTPYACTFTGGSNPFGTAMLLTLRGESALTWVSATNGTPNGSAADSCVAANPSGSAGQGFVIIVGTGDPCTISTVPGTLTAGTAGLQNTNTGRTYYETLGTSGTRTFSGLTPDRSNGAISILLNGATAAGTQLTVENATLTLTGESVGTNFGIVQVEGTLSLTGQDVGLLAGQGIAVDEGTLTLSGQDVQLLANQNFTLPVTNAALTVEGQDLPFLLTVPWTEGTITLAGQDVTLIAGISYTLAVDNAALTLTGQDITLDAGADFSLSVDNGTITLTGQDVTLTALTSLTLQVDSATLVLSAGEVQLLTPYVTGAGGARDCRKRAGIRLINYGR
jgi:hypothetical protein